tara:strand:- start:69 stop:311 length:243 start_codon:yes stop_codon:yes gene_type:complete
LGDVTADLRLAVFAPALTIFPAFLVPEAFREIDFLSAVAFFFVLLVPEAFREIDFLSAADFNLSVVAFLAFDNLAPSFDW